MMEPVEPGAACMISSSKEMPSTRDILKDEFLNFNCYQFSRGVKTGRPLSRRWVSAEQCLCTRDTPKICDPSRLYSIHFYETSNEEEANKQKDLERYPDISADRIGVFSPDDGDSFIYVPPQFLDTLWTAALAADGVLRSIQLSVQPQKADRWAVFETTLKEEIAETFELPVDKRLRPKVGPPRADPIVVELGAMRAQLLRSRFWPGVAIIAIGVLIALWIANLWH
jgi:hypothetical protein